MLWIFTAEGSFYKRLNFKLKWTLFQISSVDNCFLRKVLFVGWLFCFWLRGTIINKFCQKLGWDKIYKWTCLAALFETIEAVKLTFDIGLQNGFDVNCLTLGLRLALWPFIIKSCYFTVDKEKLWYDYIKLMSPGNKIWFWFHNVEMWTSPGNLKSLNCMTCIVTLLKGFP